LHLVADARRVHHCRCVEHSVDHRPHCGWDEYRVEHGNRR
jgi:hypothetical protein